MDVPSRWRGWSNAEQYDSFVREHDVYDWLNARLVDRARLGRAHRVLDLGCGTGATTAVALARLPAQAEVVGLDASPEMVEVARANTLDPRASFVVGPAAEVHSRVDGHFDRALCNAAFWQFENIERVLAGLANVLTQGALFVFDVPVERQLGAGASQHPFQITLARAIEERSGRPYRSTASRFDPDEVRRLAASVGLAECEREELVYRGSQDELMELMSIPAMRAPLAPDLSDEQTSDALAEARRRCDPSESVEVRWLFCTYVRR